MNDVKARRPGRESGRITARSEIVRDEAPPSDPIPTIVPVSTAALEAVAAPPAIVCEPVPEPVAEFVTESVQPVTESVQPVTESIRPVTESVQPVVAAADDAWTALARLQAALARGFTEIAVEITGMTRSGVAVAADAAVAMLGARTFAEAVEINAGLAQRGADAMVESSAKLSEIGVKAMTEATRPILSRLGASWSAAGLA